MPIWDTGKRAAIIEHTPTKAQHVGLAVAVCGTQANTSTTMWRHPKAIYAHYFKQMAAEGCGLSEVKRIVDATVPGAAEPVETANDDDRNEE